MSSTTPAVRITASQIHRLMVCSAGIFFPEIARKSRYSDAGTGDHERLLGQEGEPLNPEADFIWDWLSISQRKDAMIEYAIDWVPTPDTAIPHGRLSAHRGYPDLSITDSEGPAHSIAGTIDTAAVIDVENNPECGIEIRVCDLKTGFDQIHGGLELAGDSWQVRTQAVLVWKCLGSPQKVRAKLAYACWDAQTEYGWIQPDERGFYADDLALWAAELTDLLERVVNGVGRAQFTEGPHCRYCSSFEFCPIKQNALASVDTLSHTANIANMGEADFTKLSRAIKDGERIIAHGKAVLAELAERCGELPIAGGKELFATRRATRSISVEDIDAAIAFAESQGVTAPIYKRVVNLTTIKAACGKEHDADVLLNNMEHVAGLIRKKSSAPFLQERRRRDQ